MFDGENCIRCWKRYKFEELTAGPGAFSICKVCAAKISSEGKERRRCPVDNQELVKNMLAVVLVEKCLACGGVWLDAEELQIFTEYVKREVWAKGITLEILLP